MDFKRLPFLPLHFFYYEFSHDVKRWFWVAMTTVLLAAGFAFFAIEDPLFWSLEVQEVQNVQESPVQIGEVEEAYRTYPLRANAFSEQVSFSAGPVLAHEIPTLIYWFLQLMGWAFLLTASSLIRTRWNYLFYFLFILFIYFSGLGAMLIPALRSGGLSYLADLLVVLPFLGLFYAFQNDILKWSFAGRFAVFAALLAAAFGGVHLQHGWIGLHELGTDSYFLQVFLGIGFCFFISKEPTNLLMALANNRQNPKHRMGPAFIIAMYLVWIIAMFIMANDYIGISGLPRGFSWGVKSVHLMIISAIIVVFTSQNHFHYVKTAFSNNTAYSYLLMGGAIIFLSHLGRVSSQGDLVWSQAWDRLFAILLLAMGIGHVIFIFINHYSLIQKKINLYYLLSFGSSYRFGFVWLIVLIGLVIFEGSSSWGINNRVFHSYSAQHGDLAQLQLTGGVDLNEGEIEWLESKRKNAYSQAASQVLTSAKAFHNLGYFNLKSLNDLNETISIYKKAKRFPYSVLNEANLYLIKNRPKLAIAALMASLKEKPQALLANNLKPILTTKITWNTSS